MYLNVLKSFVTHNLALRAMNRDTLVISQKKQRWPEMLLTQTLMRTLMILILMKSPTLWVHRCPGQLDQLLVKVTKHKCSWFSSYVIQFLKN